MSRRSIPEWRLPHGVTPGMWDYARSLDIADDYDEYFALNRLFDFDEGLLIERFDRPGRLVDLGCGTGRLLVAFARRGFRVVGVDLSRRMLELVQAKARTEQLPIDTVLANIVELDCIADASVDYCISMFSTLGMIRGRDHRRRVLAHAHRMLKPGGMLAIHVHNVWSNLYDPQGRAWLAASMFAHSWRRNWELGDKVFPYRGIPNMFLHVFTRGELVVLLRSVGFDVLDVISLAASRQRPLRMPWLLGRLRANGWIAFCRR